MEIVEESKILVVNLTIECDCGYSWVEGVTEADLKLGVAGICSICNQKYEIESSMQGDELLIEIEEVEEHS